jgi:hypothetical protein
MSLRQRQNVVAREVDKIRNILLKKEEDKVF